MGTLRARRLSGSSRDGYRAALSSFGDHVEVPLGLAGELDLRAWYRRVNSRGFAASTIALYAYYIENLLRYALRRRGLSRSEAGARTEAIMEGVPLADLRREMKFRESLILPHEFSVLWEATGSPRMRAFIAVDYDSACRKGELLTARIKNLTHRREYSELRARVVRYITA